MGTSYTNRIQVEIKGKTSEILMVGDIISFTGEYLGNSDYTTVLGSNNKIPIFRVFAENLKVTGQLFYGNYTFYYMYYRFYHNF